MNIKSLEIYSDSQLVVNQIMGEYQARGFKMVAYLNKAKDLLAQFEKYTLWKVPRDQNSNADALAKLASAKDTDALSIVPVECFLAPSIQMEESSLMVQVSDSWMTPIIKYLEQGVLPTYRNKVRMLQRQSTRFILVDGILYRWDTQCLYYGVPPREKLRT